MFPPDRLELAVRFAERLATDGVVRGLIGPREAPRLWERHLLNCAVLAQEIPDGSAVCDIGSGAGLPGIVLAIVRPDLSVTLVEPLLRRTTFLDEVVAELGLDATVHRGRADSLHGVRRFDVVTSRAVAPLGRLLDWSMPLVSPTGSLVAMKGSNVATEIEEATEEFRAWRCAAPTVLELGAGLIPSTTHAVRVAFADPSSVSWPPSRRTAAGRASKGGMRPSSSRGQRGSAPGRRPRSS